MHENQLLQRIYAANASLPPWVTLPPGDDMAQLSLTDTSLLVAADQLIDGVHFRLTDTSLHRVARKAVNRNISDVAAMAARPLACVATAALPRGFGQDAAAELFEALRVAAQHAAAPLVGGDLAVHDGPLHLSVTVLAVPWPDARPVTREGARVGDGIWVSGRLGGSFPTGHHLDFMPRVELAHRLAAHPRLRPHAMIDLSDGLAQDLTRLVPHARLFADRLPLRTHRPPPDDAYPAPPQITWRHALHDGEDYELLFTLDPDAPVPAELAGVMLTRVGTVTDHGGHLVDDPAGQTHHLADVAAGWEHRG